MVAGAAAAVVESRRDCRGWCRGPLGRRAATCAAASRPDACDRLGSAPGTTETRKLLRPESGPPRLEAGAATPPDDYTAVGHRHARTRCRRDAVERETNGTGTETGGFTRDGRPHAADFTAERRKRGTPARPTAVVRPCGRDHRAKTDREGQADLSTDRKGPADRGRRRPSGLCRPRRKGDKHHRR